ncbi:hypothetical protein BC939DRAFT_448423 [Gamsiella multidivaricata]|uniref:uncharacterized protein n=1 Tax=Gamsiella multidivaricata TaxID=101098 RepID=UPI00221E7B96|nr:uncharacterized protein BC939DRAFT_448423 [Gamsiella multidivaricata]KAG0370811.1 hypothetical protein BGZ54_003807 [Gamsiella multidivaricata]KAI7825282.1 hypothetical protein BC939DRAFT_448423 [Gamsiella multidivaricata]
MKIKIAMALGTLLASSLIAVSATQQRINDAHPSQLTLRSKKKNLDNLKQTIQLSPDHTFFDMTQSSDDELAATAVTPFCKSFTFLCHVRCLQRGDAKDPGNINNSLSSEERARSKYNGKGEINRCIHVPNSDSIRVLCLCNNGVDLTAEVDYALEGVVDIKAAGGGGSGIGEAGLIRPVVYIQTTTTVYKTVTKTATVTEKVLQTPTAPLRG